MKHFLLLVSLILFQLVLLCACQSSDSTPMNGLNEDLLTSSDDTADTGTSTDYDINVEPDIILEGAGENIDSPAFWEAPNLEDSLLLITAKGNDLVEIWQYPFDTQLDSLPTNTEVNGIAVDQKNNLLYLALSGSNEVVVYSLPGLAYLDTFGHGIIGTGENNLSLFQPADGTTTIYVTDDHNVYYFDDGYTLLGQFAPSEVSSMETLVADNFHEIIYIPEEQGTFGNDGVYAFSPDGTPFPQNGTNRFGAGYFGGDEEGILIYRRLDESGGDTGAGYIVVADQMRQITEFEFFDRETWEHAGTLSVGTVKNTDGIASTQATYPAYSMGIFTAVDNDSRTAVVGWDVILDAMGL